MSRDVRLSFPRLVLLLAAAGVLGLLFRAIDLPAPWLFGPLIVGAVFAVRAWGVVALPNPAYLAAQAVIGTALGGGFRTETLRIVPQHWGIFLFAVVFILFTSLFNGWLLARFTRVVPASAFLGTLPGGAGAMAALSDSLGADTALVTAMQYMRLLIILGSVALAAPLLAHLTEAPTPIMATATTPAAALAPVVLPTASTENHPLLLLALVFVGWIAALKTPIPAAAFLVPAILYGVLVAHGHPPGKWPWPVLAVAYGVMGLRIGGRFHPSTVATIRDVLLPVIGSTLVLLLASVALAAIVAHEMGIDPVSAYLAATPGGTDSVAAIGADLRIDTAFVLAMHLVRILCVLVFGPWLVRGCTRWMAERKLTQSSPAH